MASPRVFVSSTWYDLRYIRENLKYFIRTLGYEPVLSEEGSVFYDPKIHVQDACICEIPNCQLFILIIGGRCGAAFKDTRPSVMSAEYLEAARLKFRCSRLSSRLCTMISNYSQQIDEIHRSIRQRSAIHQRTARKYLSS